MCFTNCKERTSTLSKTKKPSNYKEGEGKGKEEEKKKNCGEGHLIGRGGTSNKGSYKSNAVEGGRESTGGKVKE